MSGLALGGGKKSLTPKFKQYNTNIKVGCDNDLRIKTVDIKN